MGYPPVILTPPVGHNTENGARATFEAVREFLANKSAGWVRLKNNGEVVEEMDIA